MEWFTLGLIFILYIHLLIVLFLFCAARKERSFRWWDLLSGWLPRFWEMNLITRRFVCTHWGTWSKTRGRRGGTNWFSSFQADVFSYGIILCEIIARIQADPDFLPRTEVNRNLSPPACYPAKIFFICIISHIISLCHWAEFWLGLSHLPAHGWRLSTRLPSAGVQLLQCKSIRRLVFNLQSNKPL